MSHLQRFSMDRRARALACAALLVACGGSQSKAPPAVTAQAAVRAPAPPPLPDNPVRLLPAGARAVLVVVMPELRSSALFGMVKRWAVQAGCLDEARAGWLLERTDRVVIATYAATADAATDDARSGTPALAIFLGKYGSDDVTAALAQAGEWFGAAPAAASDETRGRFRVSRAGPIGGSALSSQLLAFGRNVDLDALLDVADGKRASWLSGPPPVHGLDTEQWLSNAHTVSLIAPLDERTERHVHRALSNLGAGSVSDGLGQSSAALALKLSDGAHAEVHVAYPGSAAAAHAAGELRALLSQASLIIRLAGLPRLDRAEVTSDQAELSITLALTADEVAQLSDPLAAMLDDANPGCSQRAAAGP